MTPDEIREAIMSHISSNWATACSIAVPNYDFNASLSTAWIRPVVLMGDTFVKEMNDGVGMRTGVLKVSIFTKPNTGSKNANAYAVRLETLFRRACINGVFFDEPNTREIGIDNGWYHTMVTINLWTWIGE